VYTPKLGSGSEVFSGGKKGHHVGGLGVTTSRPSSPMLPRQNSRQALKRED
jgi:hypothetical protein